MQKKFSFDLKALTLEDQKELYRFLDYEDYDVENFESATTLKQIRKCFDEDFNILAKSLAYLAALLAHGLIKIVKQSEERNGETVHFAGVVCDQEVYFQLDVTDYDLINDGKNGVLAVVEMVEFFRLDKLGDLFRKYPMIKKA